MSKPLNILVSEAAAEAQISSSDTTNITKMKQAMRRKYKSIWQEYLWKELIVIDREITVASGVDEILIDKDIGAVISLTEQTTDTVLHAVSARIFQLEHLLAKGSTAEPWKWTPAGFSPVATALTTNTTLKVISDSASDTFIVRVRGKDTNGNYINEDFTLNGTSVVAGTKTFQAGTLTMFAKTQLSVGTITLKDSSDNVLENIAPREYESKYPKLKLVHVTDKAYTLYLTGKLKFQDIEYDQDIPLIDVDDILILEGIAAIYKDRKEFDKANSLMVEGTRLLRSLTSEKFVQDEAIEDAKPVIYADSDNLPFLAGLG